MRTAVAVMIAVVVGLGHLGWAETGAGPGQESSQEKPEKLSGSSFPEVQQPKWAVEQEVQQAPGGQGAQGAQARPEGSRPAPQTAEQAAVEKLAQEREQAQRLVLEAQRKDARKSAAARKKAIQDQEKARKRALLEKEKARKMNLKAREASRKELAQARKKAAREREQARIQAIKARREGGTRSAAEPQTGPLRAPQGPGTGQESGLKPKNTPAAPARPADNPGGAKP